MVKNYCRKQANTAILTILECGFLIVRDGYTADPTPPGIIGMNITQRCREFALTEFDMTLGGKLDSVWREAFNHVQEVELEKTMSSARVSGKGKTHIPASSLATVYARVNNWAIYTSAWLLLEPGSAPLPGGLIPMPTLVSPPKPSVSSSSGQLLPRRCLAAS